MCTARYVVPLRECRVRSPAPTVASVVKWLTEGLPVGAVLLGFPEMSEKGADSSPSQQQRRWRAPELPMKSETQGWPWEAVPASRTVYLHIHTHRATLSNFLGCSSCGGWDFSRTYGGSVGLLRGGGHPVCAQIIRAVERGGRKRNFQVQSS